MFFGMVLDFVDGNIARFTRTTTYFGKFFDSLVDTILTVIQYPIIGIGILNQSNLDLGYNNAYIILGSFASLIHMLTVFLEAQYERMKKEICTVDGIEPTFKEIRFTKQTLGYKVFNFIQNTDLSYIFPLMIVFIFFNRLDVYLLMILVVKLFRFMAQSTKMILRGRKELNVLRPSSRQPQNSTQTNQQGPEL